MGINSTKASNAKVAELAKKFEKMGGDPSSLGVGSEQVEGAFFSPVILQHHARMKHSHVDSI